MTVLKGVHIQNTAINYWIKQKESCPDFVLGKEVKSQEKLRISCGHSANHECVMYLVMQSPTSFSGTPEKSRFHLYQFGVCSTHLHAWIKKILQNVSAQKNVSSMGSKKYLIPKSYVRNHLLMIIT